MLHHTIDLNQVEDLLSNNQIKYCSVLSLSGVFPRKYETKPDENKILLGEELKNLDFEPKKQTQVNTHLEQPEVILKKLKTELDEELITYNEAFESLQTFLIGLRLFRESIKKQRKGGILRKWFTLVYLWVIEQERGYFSLKDVIAFGGWKTPSVAERYIRFWIRGESIIEFEQRKKKNANKRYFLSTRAKGLLLRGWSLSLGERYRISPILPGEFVRLIRQEAQMTYEQFAKEIKLSVTHLQGLEYGRYTLTPGVSARIIDRFYYIIPVSFWSKAIRDEVKAGTRPLHGNKRALDKMNKDAYIQIVKNAYLQLLEELTPEQRKKLK